MDGYKNRWMVGWIQNRLMVVWIAKKYEKIDGWLDGWI